MKKSVLIIALIVSQLSFGQFGKLLKKVEDATKGKSPISNTEIAKGLKEALDKGIKEEVSKLTKTDGFYKNLDVKILMPTELQKVDKSLRSIGLGNLADDGIKMLNRAAEDAVKTATPIFVKAIKNMSFADVKNILMNSDKKAATNYLKNTTNKQLYTEFSPVIKKSFDKVGADKTWKTIISKYNTLPFVKKVNPDLTDYVTQEALNGVFKMIAKKELEIRTNTASRTSDLLKKVFSLQDKK
jgi:hypothetical protein